MSILIKSMEMPTDDMKNIMIFADGRVFQFSGYGNPKPLGTAVPVPEPHGRLINADEFLKRAIGTKCFRGDFALMLEELVGESTTIIPASGTEAE